jgi:glycosyltransferase involved in cell wall biosynthesis
MRTQFPRFSAWFRYRVAPLLLPAGALIGLTALALTERARTVWRRLRGAPARVVWGPSAILNIKYWSAALRDRGYESITCVDHLAVITPRNDFDVVRDDLFTNLPQRRRGYAMFAWALRRGDVFIRFFDMGYLRGTPLEFLEYPLTRLAGKKIIVLPFGGDVAVVGHLGDYEQLILKDYPDLPSQADLLKRRVHHSLRWANLSVRTTQLGYQPSYDATCLHLLGIDVDLWGSNAEPSTSEDGEDEVVVVHAPNHRAIKGTERLERVIEGLRDEGLRIRLEILEGRRNEEVRAAVTAGDIVADQFYAGYGLFAIEGMAAGKPVLANLNMWWLPSEVRKLKAADGCPIIDTDEDRLEENLRRLVEDPDLRRRAGQAGREFVMRNHSYEAVARAWETLIEHVWTGQRLPDRFLPERD